MAQPLTAVPSARRSPFVGLFKEVKKPVIKAAVGGSGEISSTRPRFVPKTPPCESVCPNGGDVREWLVPIAQHEAYGRTSAQAFELAWRRLTEKNPFPAICGRVCQHGCEQACNRKAKDGPVAINALEQFLGDFAIAKGFTFKQTERAAQRARVAIVGAGPSGLSCAYHLAREGYAVTILEAAPHAGGMMRYHVPRRVLPCEVLDAEIARVLALGIELHTGCLVGCDVMVDELRRDFQSVFLAIGSQKAPQLEIEKQSGMGILVGALPAEPLINAEEPDEIDRKALNTISVAIAQGRTVAEAIDCYLRGHESGTPSTPPVIKSDRLKLAWYPAAPRRGYPRATDGVEWSAALGSRMTEAEAVEEARRCMSCGMCMDCESCWMYCTNSAFVKLPKGEHYKIKLEVCNGCKKCADACPCGYLEMV
jgi:Pyruvate/2-oxoacid:ferredoxin oxidoreductase delta subunit